MNLFLGEPLTPLQDEIIIETEFDITSMKKDDQVLRYLQILKEIKERKKIDIAKKYDVSVETIRNIEKRFKKGGVKRLIPLRKRKTTNVSSSDEGAIIIEAIKHPEKTAKEIQKSVNKPVTLKKVKGTMTKLKDINIKKKILLEVQK